MTGRVDEIRQSDNAVIQDMLNRRPRDEAVNAEEYRITSYNVCYTKLLRVMVIVGNLLADILYAVVDPRIRYD